MGDQSLMGVFPSELIQFLLTQEWELFAGFPYEFVEYCGCHSGTPHTFEWEGGNRCLFCLVSLSSGIIKPLSQRLGKVRRKTMEKRAEFCIRGVLGVKG